MNLVRIRLRMAAVRKLSLSTQFKRGGVKHDGLAILIRQRTFGQIVTAGGG